MRISELASRAGVNVQTLRYYERRGLLPAPPRSPSGYRAYPAGAEAVVRLVKRAQQLGFSLGEVEKLLHLAEGGPESCDGARRVAEQRLADLERMRGSLRQLVDTCARPRADRECPLLQAVATPARSAG